MQPASARAVEEFKEPVRPYLDANLIGANYFKALFDARRLHQIRTRLPQALRFNTQKLVKETEDEDSEEDLLLSL
jgi:hypothetical protein